MLSFDPLTEPSRRPKKSLVATSTSLTLKQMLMIRVRRRKKTRMKRVGTDPRSRQRGGKGGRAFLRSTSPASSRAVIWRTKTMRSAPQICPRGFRCVNDECVNYEEISQAYQLDHWMIILCLKGHRSASLWPDITFGQILNGGLYSSSVLLVCVISINVLESLASAQQHQSYCLCWCWASGNSCRTMWQISHSMNLERHTTMNPCL